MSGGNFSGGNYGKLQPGEGGIMRTQPITPNVTRGPSGGGPKGPAPAFPSAAKPPQQEIAQSVQASQTAPPPTMSNEMSGGQALQMMGSSVPPPEIWMPSGEWTTSTSNTSNTPPPAGTPPVDPGTDPEGWKGPDYINPNWNRTPRKVASPLGFGGSNGWLPGRHYWPR